MDKFVYMMQTGEDHFKIGIANDVMKRVSSIQTGSPTKVSVVAVALIGSAADAEAMLHKYLEEYKTDGGSEWFKLSPDKALTLASKVTMLGLSTDLFKYVDLQRLVIRQTKIEKEHEAFILLINDRLKDINALADRLRIPVPIKKIPLEPVDRSANYRDDLFDDAVEVVNRAGKASASMLQRRLRVGYARAARLIDLMETDGIIGRSRGAKARELVTVVTHV